jgi:hypothetical protein
MNKIVQQMVFILLLKASFGASQLLGNLKSTWMVIWLGIKILWVME